MYYRLEGNEVPCSRWEKETGRKAEGFAGRALHSDLSPKSSEEPYYSPPGWFSLSFIQSKNIYGGPIVCWATS